MSDLTYLGHYRLERRLGEGHISTTFLAYDTVRRRRVALKVLKSEAAELQTLPLAVLLERAQSASDLVHPHLAWVWESGEVEGQPFLTERYIHGAPLSEKLHHAGPLTWEEAFTMINQIAHGLDFAHQRGFFHGSVSPGNILRSEEHGAVLTDIGFMHAVHHLARHLQTSFFKRGYSAPEAILGDGVTPSSDQFSLACVLYEALTACHMPDDFQGLQTGEEVQHEALRSKMETMPKPLREFLKKAWNFSPELRYGDMREFIEALHMLDETNREAIQAWLAQPVQSSEPKRAFAPDVEQERMLALEQARREIEEHLRQALDISTPQEKTEPLEASGEGYTFPTIAPTSSPARMERSPQQQTTRKPAWVWPVSLLFLLILLVGGGLWLDRNLGGGGIFIHTDTATSIPPSSTYTSLPTPSPSATPTPTASPTFTSTPTHSLTPSLTPSPTNTATITPTQALTATNTPRPRETIEREITPPLPTFVSVP